MIGKYRYELLDRKVDRQFCVPCQGFFFAIPRTSQLREKKKFVKNYPDINFFPCLPQTLNTFTQILK